MRVTSLLFSLMLGSLAIPAVSAAPDAVAQQELPPPSSDPVIPVPRDRDFPWMSLATWKEEHAKHCADAAKGEAKLIFLGDSITAMTQNSESWKQAFGAYRYVNFGIGGDRTQNVLWRLENGETGKLKPKLVVLLIGTNNIGITENDVADTVKGVTAVVGKLRKSFPKAKILLLGLFPRDENPGAPVRAKIHEINAGLAKLADGKTVIMRDIGGIFLEADGTLSTAISVDHLHLTEEGMRRWSAAIAPEVKTLMK